MLSWRCYEIVTIGVSRLDVRSSVARSDWDVVSQRLAEPGTRTNTSAAASIADQSPSNSSWASAAAGKRASIALTASGVEVVGSVSSYTTPGAPGACPTSKATWQSSGSSRTALIKVSVPAL